MIKGGKTPAPAATKGGKTPAVGGKDKGKAGKAKLPEEKAIDETVSEYFSERSLL